MNQVDVLAEMANAARHLIHPDCERMAEARAAAAELLDCVGDAQSLLAEIDKAVRAEHAKNGHPKSQSVAGIINARLTAALARCGASA